MRSSRGIGLKVSLAKNAEPLIDVKVQGSVTLESLLSCAGAKQNRKIDKSNAMNGNKRNAKTRKMRNKVCKEKNMEGKDAIELKVLCKYGWQPSQDSSILARSLHEQGGTNDRGFRSR